jgi:hypothetical protein
MVPGWVPFKIVSVSAFLYQRWPPLLKIEISSNDQNCSMLSQNVPKFELYKNNDELINIYYRMFYELWTFVDFISSGGHLWYRNALTDTILKGTHPGTIPARFALIWFSGFRGEDLNVIFYQNMPNLHNRYKSAERKISQKNPEYMLNYSLPCSCS